MKKITISFLVWITFSIASTIYAQHMDVNFNPAPNPTNINTGTCNTVTIPITYTQNYADRFYDCDGVFVSTISFFVTCTITDIYDINNTYSFQVKPDNNISPIDIFKFVYDYGCQYNPSYPSSGPTSFSFSLPAGISSDQYLLSVSINNLEPPIFFSPFSVPFNARGKDITTGNLNTCSCTNIANQTVPCSGSSSSFPCNLPNILQINVTVPPPLTISLSSAFATCTQNVTANPSGGLALILMCGTRHPRKLLKRQFLHNPAPILLRLPTPTDAQRPAVLQRLFLFW